MKRIGRFLAHVWQPAIGYSLAACFFIFLLYFRLGTLNNGWSAPELQTRTASKSVRAIIDNPINAPHKAGVYLMLKSGFTSPQSQRMVSAVIGLIAIYMFYILIKRWHTRRIAVISTLLFGTNSFFLTIARNGTPTVMWLMLLIFISVALYFRHSRRPRLALIMLMIFTGLSAYIPGMLWFIILALAWQWPMLPIFFRHFKIWQTGVVIFLFLVLTAPLIYGVIRDVSLIKNLLLIPQSFQWQEILANLGEVPSVLFFKSPANAVFWLGTLPLLDIFATVMFVLGLYSYRTRLKMDRTLAITAIFVVGTLLVALSGNVEMITLILPFVYVIIAGGITFMLQQWFTVFPFNPIARTLGPTIISVAVLVTASYHIARYFIAWPSSPETKAVYIKRS